MGAFLSPESSSEQTLNNSPQAVSGNGVAIRTGRSSNLGTSTRNSGNVEYRVARGGTLTITNQNGLDAQQLNGVLTGLSSTINANINSALAEAVKRSSANSYTVPTIGQQVLDRAGEQITDAPADDAKQKQTLLWIVLGVLGLGGLAFALGRK